MLEKVRSQLEGAGELLRQRRSGWSAVGGTPQTAMTTRAHAVRKKSQKKVLSVFVHDFPFSLNEERFKIQTCQISDQGENQRYAKQTIKKRKYSLYGSLVKTAQKRVI